MEDVSGVGVLDKAALVLTTLEAGPMTLAALVSATGLARPTAHRLAVALEHHRFVTRDHLGRFILGPRLAELASAAGEDRLVAAASPVLARLRDITGESAHVFRRQGESRVCVASAERLTGLRDSIPVGSSFPLTTGSPSYILLAWEEPDVIAAFAGPGMTRATLAQVRKAGFAQSIGDREAGLASVAAPVRAPNGKVIAAVSVSGPVERLTKQPARAHAPAVVAAANLLTERLRRS
ncbi:MAG: IclR family transcriptional regulator [Propionibacteriaceae bacterium]